MRRTTSNKRLYWFTGLFLLLLLTGGAIHTRTGWSAWRQLCGPLLNLASEYLAFRQATVTAEALQAVYQQSPSPELFVGINSLIESAEVRMTISPPRIYKGIVAIDIFTEFLDSDLSFPVRHLLNCIASEPNRYLVLEDSRGRPVPLIKPLLNSPGRGHLVDASTHAVAYGDYLGGAWRLDSVIWIVSGSDLPSGEFQVAFHKLGELEQVLAYLVPGRSEPVRLSIRHLCQKDLEDKHAVPAPAPR